jgi:uncharacterized phiE125 gp8 family phage protein
MDEALRNGVKRIERVAASVQISYDAAMTLKLVTPPVTEPVTLDELKQYLRIDHADDDAEVSALGVAAREFVETYTGLALPVQTWELTARDWPACVIVLPKPPLQVVVSIKHRTAAGAVVTLAANTDYIADLAGGTVEPVTSWPRVGDYPDAVQVRFTAGGSTPESLKLAIKSLAAHWYDNRSPVETADGATRRVPFHVKALLAQARGGRLEAAAT